VSEERFLVTGAFGVIGAWTVATLVREGVPVVAFDIGDDHRRLRLILGDGELAEVVLVRGDTTERGSIERALDEHEITHVVHLAALLIPLIKADPPYGALVNVVGTLNVFASVKERHERIRGLAYASSIAAYDRADDPGYPVPADAIGHPVTHYGVNKQANEGAARIYWLDDGVASVGLRPYIVYGPGRDTGLTAAPSLAMAAAARGQGYHIPFGGRIMLQHAADAAAAFIAAARAASEDARVFNLGGGSVHVRDCVAAIERAAPEVRGMVTFDDDPLPFPDEFESETLERALGPLSWRPLDVGVQETVEHYRRVGHAVAPAPLSPRGEPGS
jgi:nucleoside-diphosphate-sugar epimerase